MDRILRMIIKMVIGRLINRGVRGGIKMMAERGKRDEDDGWTSVQSAREKSKPHQARPTVEDQQTRRTEQAQMRSNQKRAQRGINIMRRFLRF